MGEYSPASPLHSSDRFGISLSTWLPGLSAAIFAAKKSPEAHILAAPIKAAIMVKIVALIYASIETFIRDDTALRGNFGRKAGYASRRRNSNCNPPQCDHFPLRQAYINTHV